MVLLHLSRASVPIGKYQKVNNKYNIQYEQYLSENTDSFSAL